ncbi:MAG: efflux RND transporter periplasmic adaptor subunit [Luteolibacter sp.]
MQSSLLIPLSLTLLLLPSCGKKQEVSHGAPPPAQVTFVPVAAETVEVVSELPGRIDAVRTSEVRARVAGILLKRNFTEGTEVNAGDLLFEIDPAPFQAAYDNAVAALARTEATRDQAASQAERVRKLASSDAVSKQDLDNAEATLKVSEAEVLAAESAKKTAALNLGYASVTAPISGRIGRASVTEGALVGQGAATLLATIQQLDPVYFDFTQSSGDFLAMKKAMSGKDVKITLMLEDGTEYPHAGKLLATEVSVDQSTGMVALRAEFPNPDRDLLPGMFTRAKVVQAVRENALTIPQRAVTRAQGGMGHVLVIGENDVVEQRSVRTSEVLGDKWVIASGLQAGERVIVEGLLKARPGEKVHPQPIGAAPAADTPANH